ncbi:MAG: hypothetical protein NTX07_09350 [Solirubrobacterales bacterium]|nr:hypothetical protein [Solirubrobacterales bacterium]
MRSLTAKFTAAVTWALVTGALIAPAALARINGGEGLYGPTTDKVVTNFGFGIIFLFPLLLVILSILQHRKEDREHEHLAAQSHRADLAEWQGGW